MCICRGADIDNNGACVTDDAELLQSAGNEFYHLDSADDLTTSTGFQLDLQTQLLSLLSLSLSHPHPLYMTFVNLQYAQVQSTTASNQAMLQLCLVTRCLVDFPT